MAAPKYTARIGNIFFLTRIGSTLRWATSDIAHEELPGDIQHLLRRLDRMERKTKVTPTKETRE